MKSSALCLIVVCPALVCAQPPTPTPSTGSATTVVFDTTTPQNGLFPSDAFTTQDSLQKTGERVNLPTTVPLNTLLNQLDGFSVNPRVTVCFSGAIDPSTVQKNVLIYLNGNPQQPIGLNQLIYDPDGSTTGITVPSNCIYGKPEMPLAESTQYLLIVKNGVRDLSNKKIAVSSAYTACVNAKATEYCSALSQAVQQTKPAANVAAASLFTTMSSTAWLENAKKFVDLFEPSIVFPAGQFSLSDLSDMTWVADTGAGGAPVSQDIPLSALPDVDQVAFGFFLSPNFLGADGTIATQPTTGPVPLPITIPALATAYLPISFHVFLPPPSAVKGDHIPVVIYGHGLGDTQFGAPTFIADTLAKNGYATLAIEIPGHGYGQHSTVKVTKQNNDQFTVLTPGRGVALPRSTAIGPTDGCIIPQTVAVRDCARQAAVDLMALVRTISLTNGLGLNLDPGQIFYVGQSFGVTYGTLFNAVEPEIKAAVLNSGGGTSVDVARLAIPNKILVSYYLAAVAPSLLLDANGAFNDNYVFRDQPVVTNSVPGAIPTQNALESIDWLGMSGDPLGFAAMLQSTGKPVLAQFSYGDLEVPNPTESALIRAAGLQSSSWYLHFEKVVQTDPSIAGILMPGVPFPVMPHRMLSNPTLASPANSTENMLATALQNQVAAFFNSNGKSAPDPNSFLPAPFNGQKWFEHSPALPEMLNYLPQSLAAFPPPQ